MAKKLNIRPTSGVYATYKRLSYQPWTAIAEFVDNSTQSFYDHKQELLDQKYYKCLSIYITYTENESEGDMLEIEDDAYGMEWEDFQRAIVLDRPPKNTNGRNEFGMGLKTAACWFGSLWSVESTRLNSRNKYYAEIDVDQVGKYKTEEIDVIDSTVSPKEHYTKIVIRRLNKKIRGARTIGKVKELLSSIYRVDLRSGLVKIYYNGSLLQFKEAPIYVENIDGAQKEWKKEIDFTIEHEGKNLSVSGFIAIRLPGSVKDAGLTLIRRGRVIIGGSENTYRPNELFGDSNSYAWQRLFGELNMDNWPVTQAKDSFDWHNSGLEEKFINTLKELMSDFRRKADSIRVRERINSNELMAETRKGFGNGIVQIGSVTILDAPSSSLSDNQPADTDPSSDQSPDTEVITNEDDGVVIEGGKLIQIPIVYKENSYLFDIFLDTTHQTARWLLVENGGENRYKLTINMKHPFFKPLIAKKEFMPIMMRVSMALILAELEASFLSPDGRINPADIRLRMNDILENIAKEEPNE